MPNLGLPRLRPLNSFRPFRNRRLHANSTSPTFCPNPSGPHEPTTPSLFLFRIRNDDCRRIFICPVFTQRCLEHRLLYSLCPGLAPASVVPKLHSRAAPRSPSANTRHGQHSRSWDCLFEGISLQRPTAFRANGHGQNSEASAKAQTAYHRDER